MAKRGRVAKSTKWSGRADVNRVSGVPWVKWLGMWRIRALNMKCGVKSTISNGMLMKTFITPL